MATAKKVSRKQLLKEPDEFLTVSAKLFQFAVQNRLKLLGVLLAVVLIVLVVSGYNYYSRQRANEAQARLQTNWNRYETLRKEKGPLQAYQEVAVEFEDLIARYGDKTGGKMARVIFGNISYGGGDFDKAISLYEKALQDFPEPFFQDQILNSLGYAYEAKQAYSKAIEYFEKITAGRDPVLKGEALFNIGRLFAQMGKKTESRRAYQEVITDQPNSLYVELAKERVARLTPAAEEANAPPQ